jgi:hypothetical protein
MQLDESSPLALVELPQHAPSRRVLPLPPVELPRTVAQEARHFGWDSEAPATGVVAATGLMATAGYVLLNTRAFAWLLTLLASQPVWKEFDPLEVIYAWEEAEEKRQLGNKGESLLSLVE